MSAESGKFDKEKEALRARVAQLERAQAEHARTQDALRESEERYRVLFEQAADSIVVFDPETGEILGFNDRAAENLGYTREEFGALQLIDVEAVESPQEIARHVERIKKTGGDRFETRHIKKDGELRDVHVSARVITLHGRTLIASILRDITERKRGEEALRRERDFTASLLQASPTFFVAIGADGRTQMMNKAMLTALGYAEEEALGKEYLETFVPEADRELLAKVFEELVHSHKPTFNENRVRTKDGRELLVEWHGRPVFKESGELDFFFGVGIDITDRRREEEERRALGRQVRQAQKLESLGVLAGGIAHDFNNILMAILGNADLALQRLSLKSPARGNVEEILKASKRAAELSNQMLAYSGKGRFVVESIDAGKLVQEIAHLLEVSISKSAVLRFDLAENLPTFDGDATQIRQVIMNLITNASESIGDEGGGIILSTGAMDCDRSFLDQANGILHAGTDEPLREGRYVTIEVADTGCGMDAATVEKIFDPFFTTKFLGRGLGMSAVLGIVRGHRGTLTIRSKVGSGSSFKVFFPASGLSGTGLAAPGTPETEREDWRGSGTVLIADDEQTVRAVGKQMLERMGFRVVTARDGSEALERFREHAGEIVCVLLDLTMPHTDSGKVFREMRRVRADAKVILCSGYDEQDVTRRFVGEGLAGFIHKPFDIAALRAKLAEVLDL